MTVSSDSKPASLNSSSRRALLAGALGGIGAVAAGAVAKVNPVRATDGDVMTVGGGFSASSLTVLTNNTNSSNVFMAESKANGTGIEGRSYSSGGVVGRSELGNGVFAYNFGANQAAAVAGNLVHGTGIIGISSDFSTPYPAAQPKTGVYGYADQDWQSRGVWGYSGQGQGVRGATGSGVGVYGKANKNGYALRAYGRIKADKVSGVTTINAGLTSVTVNPGVKVTADSFVLLTPRANIGSRGLWYTTSPSAGTITIHLSSSRSSATKIGWLLLG